MNTSISILKELIQHLEDFEQKHQKANIKDFVMWLNERVFNENQGNKKNQDKSELNMELTHYLVTQNKYFKTYCKAALHDSNLATPDDFSFLYHLTVVDSFRKMELINIHLLEAPSGIEVLKRLHKKGFIEEFDDANDKRAKRIRITKKGQTEVKKLEPKMKEVYHKMSADMNMKEKIHFISLLKKLSDYHSENII
jgi:DNA-binding MarR family transcriptional regulator